MKICLFEDQYYNNFLPLCYLRPVWEMICGAGTIKEYLEDVLGSKINSYYSVRDYLFPSQDLSGDYLFINGRILPIEGIKKIINSQDLLYVYKNQVVAFKGTKQEFEKILENPVKHPHREIMAFLVEYPWDLLSYLGRHIGKTVIGKGADVSNKAVLDDSRGPIYIGGGTVVHPFTLLRGPLYIGKNCRIGGEIVNSIIHDYVNKAHYGFLGNSYVCSWVNLGAGTTNSNLKNNYGSVKVIFNGKTVDTKKTFLGCFIADHAKTAIGTLIYTGCVVGVSANVFGMHHAEKTVPSFAWGEKETMRLDKAEETAKAMMSRREVEFSPEYAKLFEKTYEITTKEKKDN